MKKSWFLKGKNRGASLIAVVATIAFVSIIGIIITQITVTNIQMKEIEQLSKTHFYSAEKIMDDLTAGVNTLAAQAMQEAYTEMLSQYRTVTASGGNVQEIFRRLYLDHLVTIFQAAPEPGINNDPVKKFNGAGADATVIYQVGYYGLDTLKGCFSSAYSADADTYLKTTASLGTNSVANYRADYTTGTFIVEGIKITATDTNGYTTTIATDIALHTPELNFEGSNMVKEFMRYSLIADRDINVNSPNVVVQGNAYAGDKGIHADNTGCSATFTGNTIITRGDIIAGAGSNLKVGSSGSTVWAENVKTVGAGTGANLTLDGTAYISDDLEVNGKESVVTLKGQYYGYNFLKNYGGVASTTGSEYSSAISINGKKAKLDLTGLKNLTLSGRTYIARDSVMKDVPLGESLSVRSNQMAYSVPLSLLDVTDPDNVVLADSTGAEVSNYLGVTNIYNYVPAAAPVVTYHYKDVSGNNAKAYFLNFNGNEQNANNFFAEAFQSKKATLSTYAQSYVDHTALILSSDVILTLKGDLMYRTAAGADLDEFGVTITNSDWSSGGIFYQRAGYLGKTYKSLQMYLEDNHNGITEADIRFGADNDKTQDKLMNNIMDVNAMVAYLSDKTDNTIIKGSGIKDAANREYMIVLIDNAGGTAYSVPVNFPGGLIIATGNVVVSNGSTDPFKGLILAGGTISFAANTGVQSDEVLVSKLFADDLAGASSTFAFLFRGYNTISDGAIGEVSIERYLTYDNWTKTID